MNFRFSKFTTIYVETATPIFISNFISNDNYRFFKSYVTYFLRLLLSNNAHLIHVYEITDIDVYIFVDVPRNMLTRHIY